MLKGFCCLLISVLVAILFGCIDNKQSIIREPSADGLQITDTQPSPDESVNMVNCSLMIEGTDVSQQHYVRINHQENNTELPLIAIVEMLGATVYREDKFSVTIAYSGKSTKIDTSKNDFGIPVPPGTTGSIRQIINNEIIFDGDSVRGLLRNLMGAEIIVDYDASVIYINRITKD